jgi:hypothetical protein
MRKIEAQTVQSVRDLLWMPEFSGTYFKSSNMEVEQNHLSVHGQLGYERIISVRLHGNEIFALYPADKNFIIMDCNWKTSTTKSRLNVLLACFSSGFSIFQKNHEWYFQGRTWTKAYRWESSQSVQFYLDADNYFLKLAEKLAPSKLEKSTKTSRDGSCFIK